MLVKQAKYFPQTKEDLKSLIKQRIKDEGNEVDLNDINGSAITDMSYLFLNSDFNGNISDWNVSKITYMEGMFCGCNKFNQDISKWDVSKVINMSYMFWNCHSFNQDLSSWNVSNVRHHVAILYNCPIKEEYKPKFK